MGLNPLPSFAEVLAALISMMSREYRKYFLSAILSVGTGMLLAFWVVYCLGAHSDVFFYVGAAVLLPLLLVVVIFWDKPWEYSQKIAGYVTEAFFVLERLGFGLFERVHSNGAIYVNRSNLEELKKYLMQPDSVIDDIERPAKFNDFLDLCKYWKHVRGCALPSTEDILAVVYIVAVLSAFVCTLWALQYFGVPSNLQMLCILATSIVITILTAVSSKHFEVNHPEIVVVLDRNGSVRAAGVVRDTTAILGDYVEIIQPKMLCASENGEFMGTWCSTVAIPRAEIREIHLIDPKCVLNFACALLGKPCREGDQSEADGEKTR